MAIQTTANSEDAIVLGNDTSGFLAALKLSAATTAKGNVRDDQQVFSKTSQFASVTTGSFTINGVSIAMNPNNDTLQSLLARINSSAAGVTASYDSATDKIKFTTLNNSEDNIVVANDTSGFFAAAKLSTNNTVKGNIRDDQQVFSKTSQFGAVTNGSFTINGVSIAVNASTDTLQSLLARINNSSAGVSASYDTSTGKIKLTTLANSEDNIVIANDTSGFLSAAKLSTNNTVKGNISDDQQVFSKTSQFTSVTNGSFTIKGSSNAMPVVITWQCKVPRVKLEDTAVDFTIKINDVQGLLNNSPQEVDNIKRELRSEPLLANRSVGLAIVSGGSGPNDNQLQAHQIADAIYGIMKSMRNDPTSTAFQRASYYASLSYTGRDPSIATIDVYRYEQ